MGPPYSISTPRRPAPGRRPYSPRADPRPQSSVCGLYRPRVAAQLHRSPRSPAGRRVAASTLTRGSAPRLGPTRARPRSTDAAGYSTRGQGAYSAVAEGLTPKRPPGADRRGVAWSPSADRRSSLGGGETALALRRLPISV